MSTPSPASVCRPWIHLFMPSLRFTRLSREEKKQAAAGRKLVRELDGIRLRLETDTERRCPYGNPKPRRRGNPSPQDRKWTPRCWCSPGAADRRRPVGGAGGRGFPCRPACGESAVESRPGGGARISASCSAFICRQPRLFASFSPSPEGRPSTIDGWRAAGDNRSAGFEERLQRPHRRGVERLRPGRQYDRVIRSPSHHEPWPRRIRARHDRPAVPGDDVLAADVVFHLGASRDITRSKKLLPSSSSFVACARRPDTSRPWWSAR